MKDLKFSLVVPIYNQLNDTKGILAQLLSVTSLEVEWIIIDNGSTDPVGEFVKKYLKPPILNYIRNEENRGVLATLKQGYEAATGDVIAFTHNDVLIYEKFWDRRVLGNFKATPDLGMMGFFGCQGTWTNGGRLDSWSNMLEAELHGLRLGNLETKPVSHFDGLMLICRKEMLDKGGLEIDDYLYHHLYDRHISLLSLERGYKNTIIGIPFHHWSGITANRPDYQNWITEELKKKGIELGDQTGDQYCHAHNTRVFNERWGYCLPHYVGDKHEFKSGEFQGEQFKVNPFKK